MKKEAPMSVVVIVRARLKAAPEQIQKIHDEVTGATKDAAVAAGDLTHAVYLDPRDRRSFLGIDTWKSAEAAQQFAANPKIQEFFAQMFDGPPDVTMFEESGWRRWW
jgi:quinol monooxygenase YgiN